MIETYFTNKVAIITGSRMGIGKEIAKQFLCLGARVVLNARNADRLEETANQFKTEGFDLISICADVSVPDDCERLINKTIRHYGKLDILVHNAGLSGFGNIEDSDLSVVRKIFEVNLLGPVYLTKYALPHIKTSHGSVLFISSLAGINGMPGYAAYSGSKMGLTSIAESLRMEVIEFNIHVGIAYVGFTLNDPEKKVYNPSGILVGVPARNNVSVLPVKKTAKRIIRQIKKRKFKDVHTLLGKMNWFLYKLFPGLVFRIIMKSIDKFQSKS